MNLSTTPNSRLYLQCCLNDQAIKAWFTSTRGVYPLWVLLRFFLQGKWLPTNLHDTINNLIQLAGLLWADPTLQHYFCSRSVPWVEPVNEDALSSLSRATSHRCPNKHGRVDEKPRKVAWREIGWCPVCCHPDTEIFSKRRKIYTFCVDGLSWGGMPIFGSLSTKWLEQNSYQMALTSQSSPLASRVL